MTEQRIIAQRNHEAALRTLRAAEDGNDLAAWEAAEAAATITRRALVAAEIAHPTAKEIMRDRRTRYLRNRGIDC